MLMSPNRESRPLPEEKLEESLTELDIDALAVHRHQTLKGRMKDAFLMFLA